LWSADTSGTPEARSGVIGFAYVGGICESTKYSINEEHGGFQSIGVISHELGHKYIFNQIIFQ